MSARIEQLLTHLDQVARSTAAGVDPGEAADGGAALLFTGRSHVMVPDLLLRQVESRQLDPDAAVTWQMLRRAVTGATPAFYRLYAFVQSQIHCSKPKAGAVVALLRVTRWLTLRDVRDRRGHRLPFVALLHESPLKLEDTLLIDPQFRAFAHRARGHRHPMIAAAAVELLDQLAECEGNQPVAAKVKKIDQGSAQNQKVLLWERPKNKNFDSGNPDENQPVAAKINFFDPGPAVRSSSSSNTTTTTEEGGEIHFPAHARVSELLPAVREVIGRSALPHARLQEVVFEWAGALIAPDSRIERPIPYLCSLLRAAERGEFLFTDLGLREKGRAGAPAAQSATPAPHRPRPFPSEKKPPADWAECLANARRQVTEPEYTTWLAPLHAIDGGDTLWLYAPNPIVAERVRDDYLPLFQDFYAARPGGVTVSQEIFR